MDVASLCGMKQQLFQVFCAEMLLIIFLVNKIPSTFFVYVCSNAGRGFLFSRISFDNLSEKQCDLSKTDTLSISALETRLSISSYLDFYLSDWTSVQNGVS